MIEIIMMLIGIICFVYLSFCLIWLTKVAIEVLFAPYQFTICYRDMLSGCLNYEDVSIYAFSYNKAKEKVKKRASEIIPFASEVAHITWKC